MASCRAMNANMLCTKQRKSRSVPPDRSSGRDTVNGMEPFVTFGPSVRREPCARSDFVLVRDKVALRWLRLGVDRPRPQSRACRRAVQTVSKCGCAAHAYRQANETFVA